MTVVYMAQCSVRVLRHWLVTPVWSHRSIHAAIESFVYIILVFAIQFLAIVQKDCLVAKGKTEREENA